MDYKNVIPARFIERENRFVARVSLTGGEEVPVHVKNTGRCRELLVPGATVYLEDHSDRMGSRKYGYDLIAVEKATLDETLLINMDSQAPNKVVKEALECGHPIINEIIGSTDSLFIRPETTFGSSRFDFYLESGSHRAFIEVKGVTLEDDGVARFPDAPTERGVKHIRELEQTVTEGYEAYIIFLIQMKGIRLFEPNDGTHPEFGDALRHAEKAGVGVLAYDCRVEPDRLELDQPIQIRL